MQGEPGTCCEPSLDAGRAKCRGQPGIPPHLYKGKYSLENKKVCEPWWDPWAPLTARPGRGLAGDPPSPALAAELLPGRFINMDSIAHVQQVEATASGG